MDILKFLQNDTFKLGRTIKVINLSQTWFWLVNKGIEKQNKVVMKILIHGMSKEINMYYFRNYEELTID